VNRDENIFASVLFMLNKGAYFYKLCKDQKVNLTNGIGSKPV
jgi:hypothetical protein